MRKLSAVLLCLALVLFGCSSGTESEAAKAHTSKVQYVVRIVPTSDGNAYVVRLVDNEKDDLKVQYMNGDALEDIPGVFEVAAITPLSDGSAVLEEKGVIWRLRGSAISEVKSSSGKVSAKKSQSKEQYLFVLSEWYRSEAARLEQEINSLEDDYEEYD